MRIKLEKGSRKRLNSALPNPKLAERILDRYQSAVPHLQFTSWKVLRTNPNTQSGVFEQNQRRKLRVCIVSTNLTFETFCSRHGNKVLSTEDRKFLKCLSEESANVLTNGTDSSLANYGAESVANFIKDKFKLQESPLSMFHFLRGISQQTYENQRIPYGVIILPHSESQNISAALVSASENKRFKHLSDGYSTVFLVDSRGNLLGIEAMPFAEDKGASSRRRPIWFANLAEMAGKKKGIGVALNRNGDILVAVQGKLAFSQRSGVWKRWDHTEIIRILQSLPRLKGKPYDFTDVLTYIYQVSLDLSFRRSGGLFVILGKKNDKKFLLSSKEEIGSGNKENIDQELDKSLSNRKIYLQKRQLTADLASLDGAIVIDRNGNLISYGQVLRITNRGGSGEQGARTRAATVASKYGLAIKVSSDGDMSFYADGNKKFEI